MHGVRRLQFPSPRSALLIKRPAESAASPRGGVGMPLPRSRRLAQPRSPRSHKRSAEQVAAEARLRAMAGARSQPPQARAPAAPMSLLLLKLTGVPEGVRRQMFRVPETGRAFRLSMPSADLPLVS